MTRVPTAAPRVPLPSLPAPQQASVDRGGRDFAEIGEALAASLGAITTGFRAQTSRTLSARNLAAQKQQSKELDFKNQASVLQEERAQIRRNTQQLGLESQRALKENEVAMAAEALLTQEARIQAVEAQLGNEENRNLYRELTELEESHVLGWLKNATPEEALKKAEKWRFVNPANAEMFFTALAHKIGLINLATMDKKRRETPQNVEFRFSDEFVRLKQEMIASGVPAEVMVPWERQVLRGVNDRARDQATRLGREEQRQFEEDTRNSTNLILFNHVIEGGSEETFKQAFESVKALGAATRVGLPGNDEGQTAFANEHFDDLLFDAFAKALGKTERDPDLLLKSLQFAGKSYWDKYGTMTTDMVNSANEKRDLAEDEEHLRMMSHAIGANLFGNAMELAEKVHSPIMRANAVAKIATARTKVDNKRRVFGNLDKLYRGDPTWDRDLIELDGQIDEWYEFNLVETNNISLENYIGLSFLNNKSMSYKAAKQIEGLIKGGQYAVAGQALAPSLATTPKAVRDWIGKLKGGGHLLSALIANDHLTPLSGDWANAMDLVDSHNITKWRQDADTAQQDMDNFPTMRVKGKEIAGRFVGSEQKDLLQNYLYQYTVLADEGRLTPEELAPAAMQQAVNDMATKVLPIPDSTSPSGFTFASSRVFGQGNVIDNRNVELITTQLKLAEGILDPFLAFGDPVKFRPNRSIRIVSSDPKTGASTVNVFIPGFIDNSGVPMMWYRYDERFDPRPKGFRGEGMINFFPNKENMAESKSRFFRIDNQKKIKDITGKLEAGVVPELKAETIGQLHELQRREQTAAFLNNDLKTRYDREDLSKDYLYKYNPLAGTNITKEEYGKRMGFNVDRQIEDWTKRELTNGVWDDQTNAWRMDQMNQAFERLDYPEEFFMRPQSEFERKLLELGTP